MEPIHNNIVIAKQAVMVVLAFYFFLIAWLEANRNVERKNQQTICLHK